MIDNGDVSRVAVQVVDRQVPFLDAETIAVFKLLFFRAKDMLDLERLVSVRSLDHRWVRDRVSEMLGDDDPGIEAWNRIVAEHARA